MLAQFKSMFVKALEQLVYCLCSCSLLFGKGKVNLVALTLPRSGLKSDRGCVAAGRRIAAYQLVRWTLTSVIAKSLDPCYCGCVGVVCQD